MLKVPQRFDIEIKPASDYLIRIGKFTLYKGINMIKIYGSPQSSSGRCFWTLEEVGATYEAKSINFRDKEHKGEEYLKINKNGKVPALVDGDFTIWESMAINFYLAEKFKPELLGKDLEQKAIVRQWSIWAIADLQPPMIQSFIQRVFVPEERRSQSIIDENEEKIGPMLEVLENSLEHKFLAGENFTLADINVVSVVDILDALKYDTSAYPKLTQWVANARETPSYGSYKALCK